jgi:hypothetical protein
MCGKSILGELVAGSVIDAGVCCATMHVGWKREREDGWNNSRLEERREYFDRY